MQRGMQYGGVEGLSMIFLLYKIDGNGMGGVEIACFFVALYDTWCYIVRTGHGTREILPGWTLCGSSIWCGLFLISAFSGGNGK